MPCSTTAPEVVTDRGPAKLLRRSRHAEDELREREQPFRALASSSREASISTDGAGRITYLNPAGESACGCSRAAATGRNAAVLLSEKLGTAFGVAFESFRASWSGSVLRTVVLPTARTAEGDSTEMTLGALEHDGERSFTIVIHGSARRTRAERELAQRDAQLADAQQLARLGTFEFDLASAELSCSPELSRIYDLRPGGRSWQAFLSRVHPADIGRVRADITRALQSHRPVSTLHCVVRGDGMIRELHTRMKVVEGDGSGASARMIGMSQDVTEQKREAEERREARERFRLAFENAPIGMALTAPDGRWLQVNRTLCDITGYAEDVLLAGASQDITHPDDRGRAAECARRLMRREARSCQFELRYIHAAGHAVDAKLSVSLVRDVEDEPSYLIAHIEDITERREIKDALRESRQRLQGIIDNTEACLYLKDLDGRYLLANAASAEVLGRKPEELVGKTDFELWPGAVADEFVAEDRAVIDSGGSLEAERSILRDGEPRTYISQKFLLRDSEGKPYATGGISTDISERVRVEDENRRLASELHQTQRLEMVGRLAGGIAHDFNNLVAVILNYAALLEEDLAGADDLVEQAAEIRKAGEHAAALTQRLVAFSSGEIIEPQVVQLNDLVADDDRLLRVTLGEGVELVTELSPEAWAVEADVDQLQRVLLNLAVNAGDAMPYGGTVWIRTENVVLDAERAGRFPEAIEPGRYVCLSVADTGCGMTADVAARAFDPFFTTKGRADGRGLGLATVYGAVRQAGGRVELDSEPGTGTTVRVYLPGTEREAGHAREQGSGKPSRARGETILVVEDDDSVRALVTRILARAHYRVLDARGPNEAIGELDSEPDGIALLLCDVVMPALSGPKLAERLADLHPGLKVLFMSGYADEVVDALGDSGAPLLKKPFTVPGLLSSVDQALARGQRGASGRPGARPRTNGGASQG